MSLLEVSNVHKSFGSRGSLLRKGVRVSAVHDVSLSVNLGQTLGIVGESGSGKSTLGRLIVGLHQPDSGTVTFDGRRVDGARGAVARRLRREIQMIFQDPYSSLDPMKTIEYTLLEPLAVNAIGDRRSRLARVRALIERVGLGRHHLARYPYELSGGQRQRVAVARALITEPRLVVCDEPVSALDVSTQAQVVNLLRDLQAELGIALVFISHDISVVRNISDRIAVLYLGELVELGDGEQILSDPQHPYTKALLSSVPGAGKLRVSAGERPELRGEVAETGPAPAGCRLHPRCPEVMDICRTVRPALVTTPAGCEVACHLFDQNPRPAELITNG
jgi:oligopeptide/dipeptide ABC transporter ATP-binding protein